MMKHLLFRVLVVLGLVSLLFLLSDISSSYTVSKSSSDNLALIPNLPTSTPAPLINLLSKIEEGKNLLRSSPPLLYEEAQIGHGRELARKQIALAILNTKTSEIIEKRYWINEKDIKKYNKTKTVILTPVQQDSINLSVKWWNSFNSFFEFDNPNLVVVANKYLLQSSSIPDPKERSKNKYTDIVYVPYSEKLAEAEVIAAGKKYINEIADSAYIDLQRKTVVSKSDPSKIVTDIVNNNLLKNIIIVEHIDPGAFAISTDNGKYLSGRVLTIIGANQGSAFRYTGSPAGASGLAQFIKSTYNTMVTRYPSAKLIKDFRLGMADHTNAMKAMVLFFDTHRHDLETKITKKETLKQLGGIPEEMLAATYNGGPKRVINSVNNYGIAWAKGQLNLTLPKIFRNETLGYINKFTGIKSLEIF